MKVYKFGGASVRNAEGVRNLRNIIDDEQNLFIIVSAMGKTTNALERVFEGVQRGDREKSAAEIARLREYHAAIISFISSCCRSAGNANNSRTASGVL